ncbi:MAG TPA: hypothetical protein VFQ25_16805, partial [Ktedonobacterales bacterium]|nr:hypothetical protein [Ktedonobacterales bacterium]
RAGAVERFAAGLRAVAAETPSDGLFAAWRARLDYAEQEGHAAGTDAGFAALRLGVGWRIAVPIGLVLWMAFFAVSDPNWMLPDRAPVAVLIWPPMAALALIWYLTLTGRRGYALAAGASVVMAGAVAYVWFVSQSQTTSNRNGYLDLMLAHLLLLAWALVAIVALGLRPSARDLFGMLTKSLETTGVAGVYTIAGTIFVGLTLATFATIGVTPNATDIRALVCGGGLIIVLALASAYNPERRAGEQDFYRGFGKILAIAMHALLPLTLLALLIYLALVPFNFAQPYQQRDVLIAFNVVLFALMGLLVGVIPMSAADFPPRYLRWLRAGIIALATLALIVSLYLFSAIVYRTTNDALTMNRVTVIGWNILNIVLLALTLIVQTRAGRSGDWIAALQRLARGGALAYAVWVVALIVGLPWLFH